MWWHATATASSTTAAGDPAPLEALRGLDPLRVQGPQTCLLGLQARLDGVTGRRVLGAELVAVPAASAEQQAWHNDLRNHACRELAVRADAQARPHAPSRDAPTPLKASANGTHPQLAAVSASRVVQHIALGGQHQVRRTRRLWHGHFAHCWRRSQLPLSAGGERKLASGAARWGVCALCAVRAVCLTATCTACPRMCDMCQVHAKMR